MTTFMAFNIGSSVGLGSIGGAVSKFGTEPSFGLEYKGFP